MQYLVLAQADCQPVEPECLGEAILIAFVEIRKKYSEEKSLYSLFRNVIPETVFDFLREIGVFYRV